MLPNHKKLLNKKKIEEKASRIFRKSSSLKEEGFSEIHDHLTVLETTRFRVKYLKESMMPEVGVFWITPDNKILQDSIPWTEVQGDPEGVNLGDWLNYSDHAKYWDNYSKRYHIENSEYTDNPRGRVIFNVVSKQAKIILGKNEFKNKSLIKKIANSFNLNNYKVEVDSHYGEVTPLETPFDDDEI